MKLIIDIPEEKLDAAKRGIYGILEPAMENAIPIPDNATNREVIEQLENAIDLIKQDGKDWLDDRDIPILEACIKSLAALDNIRAEINGIYQSTNF